MEVGQPLPLSCLGGRRAASGERANERQVESRTMNGIVIKLATQQSGTNTLAGGRSRAAHSWSPSELAKAYELSWRPAAAGGRAEGAPAPNNNNDDDDGNKLHLNKPICQLQLMAVALREG